MLALVDMQRMVTMTNREHGYEGRPIQLTVDLEKESFSVIYTDTCHIICIFDAILKLFRCLAKFIINIYASFTSGYTYYYCEPDHSLLLWRCGVPYV